MNTSLNQALKNEVIVDTNLRKENNRFCESIINTSKGLQSIRYKNDLVLLLLIDKHAQLKLIIQTSHLDSSWKSLDLSPQDSKVLAFDLHYSAEENTLQIAYSLSKNEGSVLYLSSRFSLDNLVPLNFTKNNNWKQVEGIDSTKIINKISISDKGVLYATNFKNEDATYNFFHFGKTSENFTLPVNSANIVQLEIGQIKNKPGVFVLCKMKNSSEVFFQTFPHSKFKVVELFQFNPCNLINHFFTVQDKKGNSQLFLSGDGIYKYPTHKKEDEITIVEANSGIMFSKLNVSDLEGQTSIWVIGEKNCLSKLYYLSNKGGSNSTEWTDPVLKRDETDQFSSIKGYSIPNQLFYLQSSKHIDGNYPDMLIRFWQDKDTGNWKERPVLLKELQTVKTLKSYTIDIRFRAKDSSSFIGKEMLFSSETNQLVYIDDKKIELGPSKSYRMIIQSEKVTVINLDEQGVSNANINIEASFLKTKIPIYLNDKVLPNWMAKLSDFKSITEVNIPGTHDSASFAPLASLLPVGQLGQCQNMSFMEQLNSGIRFLDLRIEDHKDSFRFCHGSHISYNLMFRDVFNELKKFLNKNPSEFIIVSVKKDNGDDLTKEWEKEYGDDSIFYSGSNFPRVADCRGKIVLLSRLSEAKKGFPLSWSDDTKGSIVVQESRLVKNQKLVYAIQDNYDLLEGDYIVKWKVINDFLNHVMMFKKGWYGPSVLCLCFTNIVGGIFKWKPDPKRASDRINKRLEEKVSLVDSGKECLGVIVMDFPSKQVINQIIQSN